MYKLVLLRHGESQWNLENRFTGWHDVNLTEQGAPVTLAQLEACQTPAQPSNYMDQHPKAMEDSAISALA